MTTSGAIPSPSAAENTANLAVKPLVSGMPARPSSRNVITPATTGDRFASPAHCERWVASPSASRTRLITPKIASVLKP